MHDPARGEGLSREPSGLSARMVIGVLLAACLTSCGGGDSAAGSGLLLGAAASPSCGTDLSHLASRVFVDSGAKAGGSCGQSAATACPTIQQGIAACAGGGCGVLVRHGLYPTSAPIVLRDGVSVYAGCRFDADADAVGRPLALYRSVVDASLVGGAPAVRADGINQPTQLRGLTVVVRDVVVTEGDASSYGVPSIGLLINASAGLEVAASTFSSGRGGVGFGPPATATASSGGPGGNGGQSFDDDGGGAGAACTAQGPSGGGGSGSGWQQNTLTGSCVFGFCGCQGSHGSSGATAAPWQGIAGGGGGGPGGDEYGCTGLQYIATPGKPGGFGAPGRCATAPAPPSPLIWGRVNGTAWQPGSGSAGLPGVGGSGGGGGGAGGLCALVGLDFHWVPLWGQPGGGGGGGGCGGGGGNGGQQGGASIPLLLVGARPAGSWNSNVYVPGPGGDGGPGARGGAGGPGGSFGDGTTAQASCTVYQSVRNIGWGGFGGPGGPGGSGGAGAGGAGGNGGPSIGIGLAGGSRYPDSPTFNGVFDGQPGPGGPGAIGGSDPNCSAATAQGGVPGGGGGNRAAIDFDSAGADTRAIGEQLRSRP
ncbi:MAG: hypothetical protein ABI277_14790 [Burkholderiaceae bacterium]